MPPRRDTASQRAAEAAARAAAGSLSPAQAAFLAEAVYEAAPAKTHRELIDQAQLLADAEAP